MNSFALLAPQAASATMPGPSSLRGRRHGEDRLYLLPRDPHSVFAAWELTVALHALAGGSARARPAAVRYQLRIERREREGSAPTTSVAVDIPDALGGEGCYVSLPQAGGECRAVLGLDLGDAFQALLHSRWVPIPPDAPCADMGGWDPAPEPRR